MKNALMIYLQVEKIFGPGNQYVTAAKMILQVCESVHALLHKLKPTLIFFSPSLSTQHVFHMFSSCRTVKPWFP